MRLLRASVFDPWGTPTTTDTAGRRTATPGQHVRRYRPDANQCDQGNDQLYRGERRGTATGELLDRVPAPTSRPAPGS